MLEKESVRLYSCEYNYLMNDARWSRDDHPDISRHVPNICGILKCDMKLVHFIVDILTHLRSLSAIDVPHPNIFVKIGISI